MTDQIICKYHQISIYKCSNRNIDNSNRWTYATLLPKRKVIQYQSGHANFTWGMHLKSLNNFLFEELGFHAICKNQSISDK